MIDKEKARKLAEAVAENMELTDLINSVAESEYDYWMEGKGTEEEFEELCKMYDIE